MGNIPWLLVFADTLFFNITGRRTGRNICWFAQVFDRYFGILQNLHLELSRNIIHNILRNLPFRLNRTGIVVDVDLRGVPGDFRTL